MSLKGFGLWALLACASFVVGLFVLSPLLNSSAAPRASAPPPTGPSTTSRAPSAATAATDGPREARRPTQVPDTGVQITPEPGDTPGASVQSPQSVDPSSPDGQYRERRRIIDQGIADQTASDTNSGDRSAPERGADRPRRRRDDAQPAEQPDAVAPDAPASADPGVAGSKPRRRRHAHNDQTADTPRTGQADATPLTGGDNGVQRSDSIDR